jgi:hypothetical protein
MLVFNAIETWNGVLRNQAANSRALEPTPELQIVNSQEGVVA